jgi:uncharacterized membrane protein
MNGPIVLTFLQLNDKLFVSLVLTILTPFSCTTFCIDVSDFSIKMVGCLELGYCLVDFYLECDHELFLLNDIASNGAFGVIAM